MLGSHFLPLTISLFFKMQSCIKYIQIPQLEHTFLGMANILVLFPPQGRVNTRKSGQVHSHDYYRQAPVFLDLACVSVFSSLKIQACRLKEFCVFPALKFCGCMMDENN